MHCGSAEEARDVDRLLWVFRDQSFVPHGLLGCVDPALNPILVGHGTDIGEEHDVLINLAPEVPVFFGRFERVAEPVDGDPAPRRPVGNATSSTATGATTPPSTTSTESLVVPGGARQRDAPPKC